MATNGRITRGTVMARDATTTTTSVQLKTFVFDELSEQQLKAEMKQELKAELKQELKAKMKQELKVELKQERNPRLVVFIYFFIFWLWLCDLKSEEKQKIICGIVVAFFISEFVLFIYNMFSSVFAYKVQVE